MRTTPDTAKPPLGVSQGAGVWYRPAMFGLSVVLLALAVYRLVSVAQSPFGQAWTMGNGDLVGYLDGARRFIETGSPYLPTQLVPWELGPHSFIHPPSALPLFLPFLVLPAVLWWAVPMGLLAYSVTRLRPAPWAWPIMAACLLWPRTTGAILAGNTDLWAAAFIGAGAVWGWPLALLAVKPTWAPFGLAGIRDARVWLIGLVLIIAVAPLWPDYLAVIRNADLGPLYSLGGLPLVLLPVVAWIARTTRPVSARR